MAAALYFLQAQRAAAFSSFIITRLSSQQKNVIRAQRFFMTSSDNVAEKTDEEKEAIKAARKARK